MYKDDMGYRIKIIRKYICGYSQRQLAKLVGVDVETIKVLESGDLLNPEPQLILRIADVLDSFYLEFVNKEYEKEFLYFLDWNTHDDLEIRQMRNFTLALSEAIIKLKYSGRK